MFRNRSHKDKIRQHFLGRLIVLPAFAADGKRSGKTAGRLLAGNLVIPCVAGRAGFAWQKREGDGRTPRGAFRILYGYYRQDRAPRPESRLALQRSARLDGWCDDPSSSRYNAPVRLPVKTSHEKLWRDDHLYDIVLVLDYNIRPVRKPCGSAIFFHLWKDSTSSTEGCIAIAPGAMRKLLPRLSRQAVVEIR